MYTLLLVRIDHSNDLDINKVIDRKPSAMAVSQQFIIICCPLSAAASLSLLMDRQYARTSVCKHNVRAI